MRLKKHHRTTKRKFTKKQQKLYKMKGCSKKTSSKRKGGNGCSLCNLGMFGGTDLNVSNVMPNTENNSIAANADFFLNSQNQKGGAEVKLNDFNDYKNDVSRTALLNVANTSLNGGKRSIKRRLRKRKTQKGGLSTNLISQDIMNLGSQFKTSFGNMYNGIYGYPAAASPLPWKQMPNVTNLNTLKTFYKY